MLATGGGLDLFRSPHLTQFAYAFGPALWRGFWNAPSMTVIRSCDAVELRGYLSGAVAL
jgi:hypothetical protein